MPLSLAPKRDGVYQLRATTIKKNFHYCFPVSVKIQITGQSETAPSHVKLCPIYQAVQLCTGKINMFAGNKVESFYPVPFCKVLFAINKINIQMPLVQPHRIRLPSKLQQELSLMDLQGLHKQQKYNNNPVVSFAFYTTYM